MSEILARLGNAMPYGSASESASRLMAITAAAPPSERIRALEEEASKLALLVDMAAALSSQKDLDLLMAAIVEHTTRIMECDRSSVFLLDAKKQELFALVAQGIECKEIRFSINAGIAGYVARTGRDLNIPDAYQDPRFNPEVDKKTGYRTRSILCMPLVDRSGQIRGVIQCLNNKDKQGSFVPFDNTDRLLLSAVAAQTAVLLENTTLYRQMDQLFEAFVDASSRSIDDRDPCTSGHSRRVMMYSMNLARAVHRCTTPPFANVAYTRERLRQMRYACLLHDIGKIGVREHILCKATKLPDSTMDAIRARLQMLQEKTRADTLADLLKKGSPSPEALVAVEQRISELNSEVGAAIAFIEKVNGSNFLPDPDAEKLKSYRDRGWLKDAELEHLLIKKGNLTDNEMEDMRSHVTKSFLILSDIPWPQELHDVPEVAYTHHEKYDGSGYPRKLKAEQIHFDGHVMCVADIYDALTAADRPYKRAFSHEQAKKILLEEEAGKGRLLPDLVKLFFSAECFKIDPNKTDIISR